VAPRSQVGSTESQSTAEPVERRNLAGRVAHWSANHRKAAIWGWLGFVVLATLVGNALGKELTHGADMFSGEAGEAEQALYDSGLRPNDENVFIQDETLTIRDPQFQQAVEEVSARLRRADHVVNVESPLDQRSLVSIDGHTALVSFEITGNDEEAKDRLGPAEDAIDAVQARHPGMQVEQFGSVSSQQALEETFVSDLAQAEILSLPITLLILVVAFGSLVAALVPLSIGITSVMAATALVALPSQISPVDPNLQSVILLVGLAVGVDYSLFYLRREREERAAGRSERAALDVAAATSGRAVLISGFTVIAAMAGMFFSGEKTFLSFAQGTILVVAIAMFASVTVLPAILAWLGDRVERGRVPILSRRKSGKDRFWSTLVDRVQRRPWLAIGLAGGALLALSIPALNMHIVQTSTDDLPQDLEVIQTYNELRQVFPDEGVTVDVAVEADDVRSPAVAAGIAQMHNQADELPNVLAGSEVAYSDDDRVALVTIPTRGNGNDAESEGALDAIRNDVIPATIGTVEGVSVNVSGQAAASKDFRDLLSERLPLIFGFVFTLAFVLMLVTFRSIVIPIKAIVLNLLSVGAAYGILVLVFQEGLGEDLLGFTSNGGVTSWLPLFLFVLLFGLSMDYHVFILSRVREAYDGGMTTPDAVRHAISTTAGTVTSAAVVMVFVFAVFATLSFIDFKEMGVGLAVAVLIDATVVRGVLLPATMSVLGDRNWYLPRWLEWLPHVAGEGDFPPPPSTGTEAGDGAGEPAERPPVAAGS
jgi:RND superfamily putative drug exporter